MKILKGKFFVQDVGDAFRTGEILEADDQFVYLKYDFQQTTTQPVTQACVLSVHVIAESYIDDDVEIPSWSFFDTRSDVDKFMRWMADPNKNKFDENDPDNKVVPIKGH